MRIEAVLWFSVIEFLTFLRGDNYKKGCLPAVKKGRLPCSAVYLPSVVYGLEFVYLLDEKNTLKRNR